MGEIGLLASLSVLYSVYQEDGNAGLEKCRLTTKTGAGNAQPDV